MHIALLRGINVGGSNVIPMSDLKRAFEDMGFTDVKTYIQSGNVLFRADDGRTTRITSHIEESLSKRFAYRARVVVRSKRQYVDAMKRAPSTWGKAPSRKHNAIFAGAGVRISAILKQLPPLQRDLEEATCAPGVIFWSASKEGLARTTMMKIARLPVYDGLTVRNHNTAMALLRLLVE